MATAHVHHHDHRHVHNGARRKVLATYASLGGLSALVLLRNPLEQTVFPPCPLHATTGLWCPGCGATRASGLLLRGHPIDALHYNVLWVLAAPFVVYGLIAWGAKAFGIRKLPQLPIGRLAIGGMIAALAVFFVVRNLPGAEALNPLTSS